jgi:hypothetical protein
VLDLLRHGAASSELPAVLIIGGGVIGARVGDLYPAEDIDVLPFDVHRSSAIRFVADAHRTPLADESAKGVLVHAVLEHVLQLVEQTHRVLQLPSVVYAETPFVQQVPEGPYDFPSPTDSRPAHLFRDSESLDSGPVAGQRTQLTWSIDYILRARFPSRLAGLVERLAASCLPHLYRYLNASYSVDGARYVYLLGHESNSRAPTPNMINYYEGTE